MPQDEGRGQYCQELQRCLTNILINEMFPLHLAKPEIMCHQLELHPAWEWGRD